MRREVSMEEISDGKLYTANDLVKADCNDCRGCSACCQKMGQSIVLDPLDIYRLTFGLRQKFEELLADKLELNVVEGIILPNLQMSGTEEKCAFLNAEGDAAFMQSDRESAVCSRWEDIMTENLFNIFCRFTNVKKKIGRKSK